VSFVVRGLIRISTMKKVLIIEDRSSRKFLLRIFLKIYNYDTYIVTPDAVNQMIEEEAPDYVYMNINEPANGEDMKSLFENLRSDHRLRVRVIKLSDHK